MKPSIFFICFLTCIFCYSQNHGSDLQIEYKVYCDTDYPLTFFSTLSISGQTSIYQEKFTTSQDWNGGKIKSEQGSFVSAAKDIPDDYLRIDHTTKEILFFDVLPTTSILVTDNYPEPDWIISGEKKNIAGYSCVKATANYRGRTWIAWFTPDLAIPYGPWKLQGLPGLILEAYDKNEMFTMRGVKVEMIKSDLINRDFKTLRLTHNTKPITYKQFLADSDEAMENMVKQMNDKGENVELIIPPRTGYELKYEWE